MGARAGQLDAGFEARLFSRAALFLCLYTPTFLIWVRVSQQSVVIFISLSGKRTDRQIETEVEMKERERERERDCPAMLLLFSTAYRAAASWLRSLFFVSLV